MPTLCAYIVTNPPSLAALNGSLAVNYSDRCQHTLRFEYQLCKIDQTWLPTAFNNGGMQSVPLIEADDLKVPMPTCGVARMKCSRS